MTSNGAHCLATGIIDGDRAAAMCKRLLADDMYSGWGIRTLSGNEKRYNPMSYHNGSVWPHDNAMAALGLARAGDHAGVVKVLEGLFDASSSSTRRVCLNCSAASGARLVSGPFHIRWRAIRKRGRRRASS